MKTLKVALAAFLCGSFGHFLNDLALAVNDEQMPVKVKGCVAQMLDGAHSCMRSSTHLKWVCDIIQIHNTVYSIGDAFIYLGEFVFLPASIIFLYILLTKIWNRLQLG